MSAASLSLFAGGVGAFGAISSGIAGSRTERINAALAEAQSVSARQAAAGERQAAGFEADRIRRRAEDVKGSQIAAAAAGGVDVTRGSPLLAVLDTIGRSTEDISLAKYRGDVRAFAREEEAEGLEEEAVQRRRAARQSLLGGFMRGGFSLLRGGIVAKGAGGWGAAGNPSDPSGWGAAGMVP